MLLDMKWSMQTKHRVKVVIYWLFINFSVALRSPTVAWMISSQRLCREEANKEALSLAHFAPMGNLEPILPWKQMRNDNVDQTP